MEQVHKWQRNKNNLKFLETNLLLFGKNKEKRFKFHVNNLRYFEISTTLQ